MQLNDNELKQEKYAHGRQMTHRAQVACATKPPMTPGNNRKCQFSGEQFIQTCIMEKLILMH